MDVSNIEKKIKEQILVISKKKFNEEEIDVKTNLIEDLAFDSVLIVQLMLALEGVFDIIFEDEDIEDNTLTNYGKLLNLIIKKMEKK